jgi:hypothetical protein
LESDYWSLDLVFDYSLKLNKPELKVRDKGGISV